MYPWVEWSYPIATDLSPKSARIRQVVSKTLDIYGYANFCSPLFALIPGIIIVIAKKATRSKVKGDVIGLITAMIWFT